MLEAGLTPLEALQSGTIHPARFFDQEGEYGIIATNASADLILLDNNPLDDLENLKNPAGVMVRGVWLSKKSITDKLAAIARHSAEN
jgi:imidazolonepropionase-like amidohydrolase